MEKLPYLLFQYLMCSSPIVLDVVWSILFFPHTFFAPSSCSEMGDHHVYLLASYNSTIVVTSFNYSYNLKCKFDEGLIHLARTIVFLRALDISTW